MRRAIAIITLILVLLIALSVVAIVVGVKENRSGVVNLIRYDNDNRYTAGGGEIPVRDVDSLYVNWVDGSVRIVEGDVSRIVFSESANKDLDDNSCMYWAVEGGTLKIQFCKSGYSFGKKNVRKDLTIVVPRNTVLKKVGVNFVSSEVLVDVSAQNYDLSGVSGNITVYGAIESKVDINSVSSTLDLNFKRCPSRLTVDGVSQKVSLRIPSDSGFTIKSDTVSGSVNCSLPGITRDKLLIVGDGSSSFNFSSVSGSFSVDSIQ